jgi:dihydroxyacetone kinase-like protein
MGKKLINNPDNVVREMIEGLIMAENDHLEKLNGYNVIIRKDAPVEKVALISGGGSGHEPAHAGYVGQGMLDAAVAGEVFTSPTPDAIFEAIKAVDSGNGILLITKNYAGDIMNFEMAAEMAETEGIVVDQVVVNDDVAVKDSLYTSGRRGVAGTVFVHKIAGAKAAQGANLKEVKRSAEKVIKNVRTKGVAINPCQLPAAEKTTFNLAEAEMEMGIGIHGEPGTEKTKLKKVDQIVDSLISDILADLDLKKDGKIALMINGMGGTPLMELYIANRRANQILKDKGLKIHKNYVGEYMTSLEMEGLSITILKLDSGLINLLEAESEISLLK